MLTTLLLALMSVMVTGDDCGPSCGFVAPTTYTELGHGCPAAGNISNRTIQINWSDGSFSIIDFSATLQLSVGSCCSQLEWSRYSTGTVTGGKFVGQPVIRVNNYESDNQVCDKCQTTSGGITRATGTTLLAIGKKGVGQWIECSGNSTFLYSPGLTPTSIPITYFTLTIDFTD